MMMVAVPCLSSLSPEFTLCPFPLQQGLSVDITNNSELKKLQLYGPGPKFQGLGLVVDTSKKTTDKTGTQGIEILHVSCHVHKLESVIPC